MLLTFNIFLAIDSYVSFSSKITYGLFFNNFIIPLFFEYLLNLKINLLFCVTLYFF